MVVGKVMLKDSVLKRNMGGTTEVMKVCKVEEERQEVVKEWFHIDLTQEEKQGIRGWRTELTG